MLCSTCDSENVRKFKGEIAIHFPGLKNLDKPVVWVFQELTVCLDCGTTLFAVPDIQLRLLKKGNVSTTG